MFRVGFAGTETKNQTDLKVWSRDKRPSRARRRERQARLGENKQRHSHAGWSVITISLVGNFVVESILKSDTDVHTEPDRNWKESVNCLTLPGPALSLGTFGESFVDQAPLGLALPASQFFFVKIRLIMMNVSNWFKWQLILVWKSPDKRNLWLLHPPMRVV